MYSVKTQISFEAAHRLYDVATYSEECRKNIHGHSYKVTVVVGRSELNDAGMVVDFKQLKEMLRRDIEERYDHSCVLRQCDPLADVVEENCDKVIIWMLNPTAENMAMTFYKQIEKQLNHIDSELKLQSVAVQETENNIAIYTEEDI